MSYGAWLKEHENKLEAMVEQAACLPKFDGKNAREARSLSDTMYAGFVCDKHPELHGLRFKKRGLCYRCKCDARKAYKQRVKQRNSLGS